MTREKTNQNGDAADWRASAKPFLMLQGGPVITIPADAGNAVSQTRMQNQIDIVRDISERLDAGDIGYMLTGSMVMNCYALPCVPRNLDLVVALRPKDAELFVRLLSPDYDISREALDAAIAQQSSFNFFHRESRFKVNCIVCQQINYRRTEFSRRQRVHFENLKTWIVSKEDLLISKLYWARKSRSPRHLRDATNLAATGCDTNYVERWTRALGIFTLWQECSPK